MSIATYLRLDAATGTTPRNKVLITANLLTTGGSTATGTSYNTASISPAANKAIILVCMYVGDNIAPSGISGAGLTFTKLAEGSLEGTWSGASVWIASAASPSSGALTITFGTSHQGCVWHVAEFDCDVSLGRNGAVQASPSHFTTVTQSTTVFTGSSSGFLDDENGTVLIGVQNNVSASTNSPGSGLTELSDNTFNLPADGRLFHIAINWANVAIPLPQYTNSIGSGTQFAGTFFIELAAKAASTGYSLTANGGSVAAAGQSANLRFGHKLVASSGAVAVAGTSANLKVGRKVVSQSGAVNFAGQTATLIYTAPAVVIAQSGAVAVAGTSATLKRALRLSASGGTIAVTGQSVTLKRSLKLTAQSGSTAVAGQNTGVRTARKLGSSAGSVAVAGQAVGEKFDRKLSASAGAATVTGQSTALGKVTSGYVLVASGGSVAATGQSVGLTTRRLENAQSAAVGISGSPATLERSRVVQTSTAGTSVVGSSVKTLRSRRIVASSGARTIAGQSAQLSMAHRLSTATGAASVAGQIAGLLSSKRLASSTGSFDVAGFNAETGRIRLIRAGSGSFDISGQTGTLRSDRILNGSVAEIVLTGGVASLVRQSETDYARSQSVSIVAKLHDVGLEVPFSTSVTVTGVLRTANTTGIDARSVSIGATVRNLGNG